MQEQHRRLLERLLRSITLAPISITVQRMLLLVTNADGSTTTKTLTELGITEITSSFPPPPSRAGFGENPASAQKRDACGRRHDEWGRALELHPSLAGLSGAGLPIHDVNQQGGRPQGWAASPA